ncbi:hypothetical protein BDY24DRAFT_381863 [Mrakia frigida]|uniref:uncharacterized protein n=1 Tax=Mrakia frigida TaxID=29902 RepID=UPI003FCC1092
MLRRFDAKWEKREKGSESVDEEREKGLLTKGKPNEDNECESGREESKGIVQRKSGFSSKREEGTSRLTKRSSCS